jgi:hypothetical protein
MLCKGKVKKRGKYGTKYKNRGNKKGYLSRNKKKLICQEQDKF